LGKKNVRKRGEERGGKGKTGESPPDETGKVPARKWAEGVLRRETKAPREFDFDSYQKSASSRKGAEKVLVKEVQGRCWDPPR